MKKIKFLLITQIFVLFFVQFSHSQASMSGNGMYLASVFNKNGQYEILVHKFMTKELIRKIDFKSSAKIDEIVFSHSGKYFYIKQDKNYSVFDVMQGKLIVALYGASQVIFPKEDDFFIVLKSGIMSKYDAIEGKSVMTYSSPSGHSIFEIVMSPDDNIFAAKSVNRVFFYEVEKTKHYKEFAGFDVKFRQDGSFFTVITEYNETIRVSVINLSTMYQERTHNSEVLFQTNTPAGKLYPTRSSLSADGKYLALYTAKGSNVEIYIHDTYSGNLIWIINNFSNTSNELYPQYWTTNNTMIAFGANLMAGEYTLATKTSAALGLRIDNFTESPLLTEENQLNNRKMTNDFHYVVVQVGSDMYLRDSKIPNKKITYQNVEFLCFSNDSKYLFVKKDGAVNAIVLSQVSSALQNNTSAKLYEFDRNLSVAAPETAITNDAQPPKGYAYFYVNNSKQIVQVDTAKLHYVFRSMKISGNDVELQVNLVDRNGNEFLGATDPSWSYIWCNLLLQNPSGSVSQINDFVVEEVYENEPTAYAIILDHSGSMGAKRANDLQFGAWDLINKKRPEDAYMLIKYDTKVKVEAKLTKEKSYISSKLNNTGVTGYGGATALIDAAYIGVKQLQKSKDYNKKVIILFTDGYENASMFSKFDLLTEAMRDKIEINIIGFGNEVNEEYLMSLAYNTGGMYVHLYDTKDLRKVFRDVDFKRKHYYKIKFKTQVQGKHLAFLQLCQDQFKHDSVWIPFDNSAEKQPINDRNLVLPVKPQEIKLTQFNQLKIPINPVLKPVQNKKITNDFQGITFPNIQFATNSDVIVSSEQKGIDEIYDFMRKYPHVFLEINGHTDNVGTPEFNLDLSKRRAEAAKKLIVKRGIAPGRIVTKGFGATKPIAPNETEEGKAKNRRIEFKIFVQ